MRHLCKTRIGNRADIDARPPRDVGGIDTKNASGLWRTLSTSRILNRSELNTP